MNFFKLQFGCLLVVFYIGFMYWRERRALKIKKHEPVFETLCISAVFNILLDGATAWSVNHLEIVPPVLNGILHLLFLCSLDFIVFTMFLYVIGISRKLPKSKKEKFLLVLPLVINLAAVAAFMPELEYREGAVSNYSMGISAYACFVMFAVYLLAALVCIFSSGKNFGHNKMITISTYIVASVIVVAFQMIFPELLFTSIVPTLAVAAAYLNMENPLIKKLHLHNQEMVMGFATLVENRDENTGGHIKRTTEYVRLLSHELRSKGFFTNILTDGYIKNLAMAAPLHDVGKIAIPDSILLKPGKLTDDEFDVMKTHAERGGEIIKKTFSGAGDDVNMKSLPGKLRATIMKNGTEKAIRTKFQARRFHFARGLWQSPMFLTQFPQNDATETRFRLKNVLRLSKKEADKILILTLRQLFLE